MGTVPPSLALDLGDLEIDGEDAVNVLLVAPAMDVRDDIACAELCGHAPPERLDLVVVTLSQTPDERMTVWRTHADHQLPDRTGFVSVAEPTRSVSERVDGEEADSVTVRTVSSVDDLTELGLKTSDFVAEWADDGNATALCFHSLTELLRAVDTQRAFRFLHVLQARLDDSNVVAHYHLDPSVHDEETINTIRATMDVVVEVEDGTWSVTNR